MLHVTETLAIADWELSESFMRASGPGGQNVNKVSTAVELRFEADRSPHLPAPVKARLKRLAGRKWTAEGAIVIQVEDTRSQARNREIARETAGRDDPCRTRGAKAADRHQAHLGSQRRRLAAKAERGEVKSLRGKPGEDE